MPAIPWALGLFGGGLLVGGTAGTILGFKATDVAKLALGAALVYGLVKR